MDLTARIAAKRLSPAKPATKKKLPRQAPNPLPIDGRFIFSSFESEVHHWGSEDPWGPHTRMPKIRHTINIPDVITDQLGNVITMPPLIGRPCFGRIETFLRHAKPAEEKKIVRDNREVEVRTRCMRCTVRGPCKALVTERINSSPEISDTLRTWYQQSILCHAKRVYTAETGRLWTNLLVSIVRKGRFFSSNDAVVAENTLRANEFLKEKWRHDKRRQRNSNLTRGLQDHFTLACVVEERDRRLELLLAFCGGSSAPRDMKRWDATTCTLVADTWLAITSLKAERRKSGSTNVARWLIASGRSNGRKERALITRVGQDMKKLQRVECLRVWGVFDPLGETYDAELNRMLGELQFGNIPPSN